MPCNHRWDTTSLTRGGFICCVCGMPGKADDRSSVGMVEDRGGLLEFDENGLALPSIRNEYCEHKISYLAKEKMDRIRRVYSELQDKLEGEILSCRSRQIAITELQTSFHWAMKACIDDDPESEPIQPNELAQRST